MKKLIIIFSLFVFLIPFIVPNKIYATVELEDPINPVETNCPPSYVGQKKCFTIGNPETKSFTMVLDKRPTPEPKTIKHVPTPSGQKPIGNHPILFAMSMVGSFAAGTDTGMAVMNEFWGQVNKVDLMAGEIANNLSDSTLLALQEAYDLAVSTGSSTWSLASDIWNQVIGQTYATMKNDAMIQGAITDLIVMQVANDPIKNLALQKAMADTTGYFKKNVFMINRESWRVTVYSWVFKDNRYRPTDITYEVISSSQLAYYSYSGPTSSFQFESLANLLDFFRDTLNKPDTEVPQEVPDLVGTRADSLPSPTEWHVGQPRIYEDLNGDKWLETQTQLQKVKDRTQTKQKTKIITEDGVELLPDGSTGTTPITKPVPLPINPGNPTTPTTPTNPDSNCNKCLPDLIPNFFGLFAVFFTFLLACIVYLGKLAVFILTIPMIPEKKFEGTIGKTFEFIKNLEIGGLEIYNTMLALVTLLFSFLIYKVIRRLW